MTDDKGVAERPKDHARRDRLGQNWSRFIESQRLRMASAEALPQLALLGIVSGLTSGGIIILFRWLVEIGQQAVLPAGRTDAFESLPPEIRFALALGGGLVIGCLFQWSPAAARQVGVVHVIERLNHFQGHLPVRNAVMQFVGAALCLMSGHSVGREGPNIHLGATTASVFAVRLGLPNNSIRTVVGCGVAAAIAAGFNTPLAGVIFAMEVVLMEYTIVGFTPIILAAVSAASLTRLVYGDDPVFFAPEWEWNSVAEVPYILLLGLGISVLAAVFSRLTMYFSRMATSYPVWVRITLGGMLVGAIAVPVPEVMGVGYDTVNAALFGNVVLGTMAALVLAKVLATSACVGLGSPGGLIAPTLVIGASAGAALSLAAHAVFGAETSHGFYAMLGMGAMMAATLQAPLAALIAMVELTANPNTLFPGMIAVISASLMANVSFKQISIYRQVMRARGKDNRTDPLAQALRRIGAASVMDRSIERADRMIETEAARGLLDHEPRWILVRVDDAPVALLPAADLARFLDENTAESAIDLMEIPAKRRDLAPISMLASLQEGLEILDKTGKEALYVTGASGMGTSKIYGVITRGEIDRAYRS